VIRALSSEDVHAIHAELVAEFSAGADPISPPGIKSAHLLESAIARQNVGFGGRLKYDTPHSNAATLCYGICMNHPFHNGNKRTSLVALLCHLDRNDYTFTEDVSQAALYDLMLRIASHSMVAQKSDEDRADTEVTAVSRWLRGRTRRVERGERVVTFRELRGILESFGFYLEDHRNNMVDLVRYEQESSWFGLRKVEKKVRFMRMPYPEGGQIVGKGLIREIRERCALDVDHGCDSQTFYGRQRPPDYFIARYRKTLTRLARV
jgi:death on curing protein